MRAPNTSSLVLLFSLASVLAPALAQGEPAPGFALLDRTDDQTKVATALGFTSFDGASGQRLDVHGQYVHPLLGWGGYGVLTWGRISFSDFGSESGLGNIELGGLYRLPGDVPVILRGGIALDTAGDDNTLIALLSGFYRITDIAAQVPDTTSLRFAASPMLRTQQGYFRADVGIDLPIDNDYVDMILRFNVGGGIDLGEIALQGEFVNVLEITDGSNETGHVLGFGARYLAHPTIQPSLTLAIPIDRDLREIIDFFLVIGVDFIIPTTGPV